MKILFISSRYDGGIGGNAKRAADKLQENGFDIELMNVPHIPIKNFKNPSFAIFGTVKAMLNFKEYDIVHAWNIPSAFIMQKIKAKKKVLAIHGVYGEQVGLIHSKAVSKIGKKAEEKAFQIPDVLTTDSKYVKNYYKNKLGVEFTHLPGSIDVSKFQEIPDVEKKKNQIIYVGRDSYEKGIDILKKIEKNIEGNVVYCTDLSWNEAMKKLKESTILVVPSRMESTPQVIKEAFYLKIPVIATKVGGIPELIESPETGILVEPENPQSLLDEINALLKNPTLQERLSENGHKFILENYTWESLYQKYASFYQNLIK